MWLYAGWKLMQKYKKSSDIFLQFIRVRAVSNAVDASILISWTNIKKTIVVQFDVLLSKTSVK